MKYLGIDYGSKRIGLAVGDDVHKIAFPREVVANKGEETLDYVAKFCAREKIEAIILGESLDFKGAPNKIQSAISNFELRISDLTKLPVYYQRETLTSAEASRSTDKANLDASAAALILQSWLDKKSNI